MTKYWITKKTISYGNLRVDFQWLMEDARDIMCDSLKPQMERNPDRNRICLVDTQRDFVTSQIDVPKNIGNYYYKMMKDLPDSIEHLMDQLFLDVCAYHNDFDAYSDTYKDINNMRPHFTPDHWDRVVQSARNIK